MCAAELPFDMTARYRKSGYGDVSIDVWANFNRILPAMFDVTHIAFRLFPIGMGIGSLWVSIRRAPIRRKSGEVEPNQRFVRASFFVAGFAMVLLSLWGLYLGLH